MANHLALTAAWLSKLPSLIAASPKACGLDGASPATDFDPKPGQIIATELLLSAAHSNVLRGVHT